MARRSVLPYFNQSKLLIHYREYGVATRIRNLANNLNGWVNKTPVVFLPFVRDQLDIVKVSQEYSV